MRVQRLGRPEPLTAPHVLDDLGAATGRARVLAQEAQDVELLRREVDLLITEVDPPGAPVDPHACSDDLDLIRDRFEPGPLGQGPDARLKLAHAERLDEVVVGAELEPEHAVDLGARRADDDDGQVGAAAPQDPAHLSAVEIRQRQVEQDQIGGVGRERARTVGRQRHLVTRGGQGLGDHTGQGAVVLDQQDAHARSVAERVRPIGFL